MKQFDKIKASVINSLRKKGMQRVSLPCPLEQIIVVLDGCIVGFIASNMVQEGVSNIRKLRVSTNSPLVCLCHNFVLPLIIYLFIDVHLHTMPCDADCE